MGTGFMDKYSLLHFISGMVAYILGIPLHVWTILHIVFEVWENSQQGVRFIDTQLKGVWPGGKQKSDTLINSIGDVFFGSVGWYVGRWVVTRKVAM